VRELANHVFDEATLVIGPMSTRVGYAFAAEAKPFFWFSPECGCLDELVINFKTLREEGYLSVRLENAE
jgi:hypothetical protein